MKGLQAKKIYFVHGICEISRVFLTNLTLSVGSTAATECLLHQSIRFGFSFPVLVLFLQWYQSSSLPPYPTNARQCNSPTYPSSTSQHPCPNSMSSRYDVASIKLALFRLRFSLAFALSTSSFT